MYKKVYNIVKTLLFVVAIYFTLLCFQRLPAAEDECEIKYIENRFSNKTVHKKQAQNGYQFHFIELEPISK